MTDVFANEQGTPSTDDQLASLIGEGKKYATEGDALKALIFSQDHIKNLETENAGLRTDLDKQLGAEEILTKLKEQQASNTQQLGAEQTMSETKSGLTEEDVANVLNKMKTEDVVKANRTEANSYMTDTFGDKAVETVADKARSLNMTVAQLQAIAENSPAAFKSLIGGTVQQNKDVTHTQTNQGLESHNLGGNVPEHGTKAYYDNLRSTDKKTYWSTATQNEMHKHACANPDKFFGRD